MISTRLQTRINYNSISQLSRRDLTRHSILPSRVKDAFSTREIHQVNGGLHSINGKLSNEDTRGKLILVRHGQSQWNVTDPERGLTARFTGWADIGMTEQGEKQSSAVGRALKSYFASSGGQPAPIQSAFCSLLSRAQDTLTLILDELDLVARESKSTSLLNNPSYHIPLVKSWRLNERHYGALVGLSKDGAERLYDKELLSQWRGSWSIPPPPMTHNQHQRWVRSAHCRTITEVRPPQNNINFEHSDFTVFEKQRAFSTSASISPPEMPLSESFSDVVKRVLPIWSQGIAPRVRRGETVLVVAHANTIRSLLFHLDPTVVTKERMKKIKIESARPLVYTFRSGKEGEDVIPGNLVVTNARSRTKEGLNGHWIETDEIAKLSFCTRFGRSQLEHEIA